ncbi:MAG: flagellar assembly protein FliW [Thermoleophilaceae bacterium]|jgi:flagellar assembly factor FliW
MSITIDSTRFGTIEIPSHAVVEFPTGLIGLGGSRYVLIARDENSPFVWLHSVDDASLALAVTNPFQFFPEYEVELSDTEAERIGITDPADADVYVTVRAAESLEDFTVNLRAPILISKGRGFQVINESEGAPVRAPLFVAATAEQAA